MIRRPRFDQTPSICSSDASGLHISARAHVHLATCLLSDASKSKIPYLQCHIIVDLTHNAAPHAKAATRTACCGPRRRARWRCTRQGRYMYRAPAPHTQTPTSHKSFSFMMLACIGWRDHEEQTTSSSRAPHTYFFFMMSRPSHETNNMKNLTNLSDTPLSRRCARFWKCSLLEATGCGQGADSDSADMLDAALGGGGGGGGGRGGGPSHWSAASHLPRSQQPHAPSMEVGSRTPTSRLHVDGRRQVQRHATQRHARGDC